MELKALGFDDGFYPQPDASNRNGLRIARVVAVDREKYVVWHETGEASAEITGKLMFGAVSPLDYPTVGDWVQAQFVDDDSFAIIHGILPRKSLLKRKTSGKKVEFQLIGANIDAALILQSLDANYNLKRLERYLVMTHQAGIHPLCLLSKSDLLLPNEVNEKVAEIQSTLRHLGIIHLSSLDGSGLTDVKKKLEPKKTYCLLGSSGVGKSTLINRLMSKEQLATRGVREKDGKGRHTTTRRQLIMLPGGAMLIDTPGMRELGNIDVEEGIADTFDDITGLAGSCRYSDCTHTHEEGCAVLEALEEGTISQGYYQNYLKLQKESEFHRLSYLEKKRKDKQFGKMVKSAIKTKR
ncbi:MAG: ribosome small subunit-dependent GTPase A [Deltaproteobacteria bacterium]|nr:ribosome small subunit-dependent GTPase A [Deltaproteobacteria bacterium]MBW2676239.1 ribosome small subunit-dependent GTPase A [Deltaproteobacteria bacterium]